MLVTSIGAGTEGLEPEQLGQQSVPMRVRARGQCQTLALLPAIAVGGWTRPFEAAVMTPVAGVGTFCTATERARESTGSAFKDILKLNHP